MIEVSVAGKVIGTWSLDEMTLAEAFALKAGTGLTPMQVERGLPEADPDALRAVVWLLRRRNEPGLSLEAVDFRLGDFDFDVPKPPDPTLATEAPAPVAVTPTF